MKRYTMSASNGSVVPHESDNGRWVEFEEARETVLFWQKDSWLMTAALHTAEDRIRELEREIERLRYPDTECSLTTPSSPTPSPK